jgi:hypothetical protein
LGRLLYNSAHKSISHPKCNIHELLVKFYHNLFHFISLGETKTIFSLDAFSLCSLLFKIFMTQMVFLVNVMILRKNNIREFYKKKKKRRRRTFYLLNDSVLNCLLINTYHRFWLNRNLPTIIYIPQTELCYIQIPKYLIIIMHNTLFNYELFNDYVLCNLFYNWNYSQGNSPYMFIFILSIDK